MISYLKDALKAGKSIQIFLKATTLESVTVKDYLDEGLDYILVHDTKGNKTYIDNQSIAMFKILD